MAEEEPIAPDSGTGESSDEFDAALEAVIGEAFPVLCERIAYAQFGGWHRRCGQEEDLAHEAAVRLIQHCRRQRRLPNDPLAYLVAIARNLARKQYAFRMASPIESAGHIPETLPDLRRAYDEAFYEESERLNSEARMELVQDAIQMLPRRQREALELYLEHPGATQRELGQKMGIEEDGFQKNLERGVKKIQQLLTEQGFNEKASKE